jgi:trk system potassium uptake protein TrkH
MIMFESLSAFGTVGLSLGLTPTLSIMGKVILAIMMFFGRLGPLTIVLALSNKASNSGRDLLRYPEGKIMV